MSFSLILSQFLAILHFCGTLLTQFFEQKYTEPKIFSSLTLVVLAFSYFLQCATANATSLCNSCL